MTMIMSGTYRLSLVNSRAIVLTEVLSWGILPRVVSSLSLNLGFWWVARSSGCTRCSGGRLELDRASSVLLFPPVRLQVDVHRAGEALGDVRFVLVDQFSLTYEEFLRITAQEFRRLLLAARRNDAI